MAQAFVGTSGWSYAHWKEEFYGGKPATKWFEVLSSRFPTVELNNTFYRMPRPEVVESWARKAPPGFRFAVKLWRGVTHDRRWDDPEVPRLLGDFLDAVSCFPVRQRAPLLVQLPPQARRDEARLDDLLQTLEAALDGEPWRVAVEVRHGSWLAKEVVDVLDSHDAALCVHDMQGRGAVAPSGANSVGFAYVRRHGPTGRYRGSYTPDHIAQDAAAIRDWLRQGRDVFVYYNNDTGGHAYRNAASLREALGEHAAPLPRNPSSRRPSRQRTLPGVATAPSPNPPRGPR